jgi:hypothetical protein
MVELRAPDDVRGQVPLEARVTQGEALIERGRAPGHFAINDLDHRHREQELHSESRWRDSVRCSPSLRSMGASAPQVRRNDVPRGTMDEVRSHVRLDLPAI